MRSHLVILAALTVFGVASCSTDDSSSTGSGSSGSAGTNGSGSGTAGSTGGTSGGTTGSSGGATGTITFSGPFTFTATVPAAGYAVSSSNTEVQAYFNLDATRHAGFTAVLPGVTAIAVHDYTAPDFGSFSVSEDQVGSGELTLNSTDSITFNVTSLGDNTDGEQAFHATVSATFDATEDYGDGGSATGTETVTATF